MKNVVWTKGTSGLEGEFQSASEVDFYIDKVSLKFFNNYMEIFIFYSDVKLVANVKKN